MMESFPHFRRSISILIAMWVTIGAALAGERSTDDIGHDLTELLVAKGRLDDAQWVCRNQIENLAEGQLPHAKWTARLAHVLAERAAGELFASRPAELNERIDPAVSASVGEIDLLLDSYPESAAADFLSATKLMIRQRIVTAAIIAASVSPPDQQRLDGLLARISRLQLDTSELHERARKTWSARSVMSSPSRTGDADPAVIAADQYNRLIQELAVQRISLSVLQTELFPKASSDFRGAAADAVVIAQQGILALPDGTIAKRSARALLVEALLRSGDTNAAGEVLRTVRAAPESHSSPKWLALQVEYELAKGRIAAAKLICDSFYGNTSEPDAAPQSIEMDFAMLDVLLASSGVENEAAAWLDFIQRRGGAFARRRAESIAIGVLRKGSGSGEMQAGGRVNPSLIAAQGEDWLRRDDPRRAAVLLREAALAESNATVAFQYAAKAAAAIVATDTTAAIRVLRETAQKNATESGASDLMLQAALLASKPLAPKDDPKSRMLLLEELLNEISQTWPTNDAAFQSNAWLCRIYQQTDRSEDAARASLELLTLRRQPDQIGPTAQHWFEYLSQLEFSRATQELSSLAATLRELGNEEPSLTQAIDRVAIGLLDREVLVQRKPTLIGADTSTVFLNQIANFRINQRGPISTDGVDPPMLAQSRWRLERDAMLDDSMQHVVGVALGQWPSATSWQKATADLWRDPNDTSISMVRKLAVSDNDVATSLRRGMDLLATVPSENAKRAAIELSNRLAATMQLASAPWYAVKLQSLLWLKQIGDADQASKRAKYILLLHPPKDPAVRQQFERFAVH